MARGAVGPLGMGECPDRASRVAVGACGGDIPWLVAGLVARDAAGGRHVVAVGARHRLVSRDVGVSGAHLSDESGLLGSLRVGVEYARLGERGRRDIVPDVGVAADARLARAVGVVIEVGKVRGDRPLVTGQTARVGYLGCVHREARLIGEMRVDLAECGDLVRQARGGPGVHVALDARDLAVWAVLPRVVIGSHLVARRAERCLVGGLRRCHERDRQNGHYDDGPEGGDTFVSERRGDEASHVCPCPRDTGRSPTSSVERMRVA